VMRNEICRIVIYCRKYLIRWPFAIIIYLNSIFSVSVAQTEADSINHIVDSLFTRASSGELKYRDLVEPSKEALGKMGEAAVPRLIEKMTTQDAREMLTLVDIFKLIGRPAVPRIVEALGAEDPYKRRLAARALGDMKDSTAVYGLLQYTDDSDYRIRAGVIGALGQIGDPRGVPPSVAGLRDEDYLVRTAAAVSLCFLADSSTIGVLLEALTDPYYGVRYKAAEALWNIGKPSIMPVKESLKSVDDTLAFYLLIEVAGNLKNKKLIKPLSSILASNDPMARAFAVEALAKIDTKKTKKMLRKMKADETHPFVLGKLSEIEPD
jgi:HEAT repeat protein